MTTQRFSHTQYPISTFVEWRQSVKRFRTPQPAADDGAGASQNDQEESDPEVAPENDDPDELMRRLVSGPVERLADVPRSAGGRAGVYSIWIDDTLVALGHAKQSADESALSNKDQADGVRGRLVGVRRQPTVGIQRQLEAYYSEELEATGETNRRARASAFLIASGRYRVVETETGAAATALIKRARGWIPANGFELPEE